MNASEVIKYMESLRNEEQRRILMGFFKTGPGEYGEGDEFLGLKVPQTREVVKAVAKDIALEEVPELLMSKWHEVRLCGLLILVDKFEKLATKRLENDTEAIKKRDEILILYLQYAEQANNWDLVDLSVHKILGHWLLLPSNLGDRDYKMKLLDELAASNNLWKQRMSIVCSWKTSQMGDPSWCLRYAEIHLHHPHDLMHKAVGWMLREMGKRCSMNLLRDFLRQHAHEMPRTMLRYAIEKMSESERKEWMSVDGRSKMVKKILFVCHGNICRSPMAEFVMKDLVTKAGREEEFYIESAATSTEEIGNPVYPPARRKLAEHGIGCAGKTARQMTRADYDRFDMIIGMDSWNLRNMRRICGDDPKGKISLLMDYTSRPGDVADPWYTGDFEATWRDVLEGCTNILRKSASL